MATEVGITQEELAALAGPESAFWYAHNIIEGRWPPGEAVIAQNSVWAYYYAHYVIKRRWHLGEAVIATDPTWALKYFNWFQKDFTEKEQVLWLLKTA